MGCSKNLELNLIEEKVGVVKQKLELKVNRKLNKKNKKIGNAMRTKSEMVLSAGEGVRRKWIEQHHQDIE